MFSIFKFAPLAFVFTTIGSLNTSWAQVPQSTDTTVVEEDYSLYDNVEYSAEGAKRFCSPKIEGLSPAKLISIGYDYQLGYDMSADTLNSIQTGPGGFNLGPQDARVLSSHGLRVGFNIPVISKTNLVWQLGANYWEQRYNFADEASLSNPMLKSLSAYGLKTAGISTTLFKPLDDKQFILFQGSADYSGNYTLKDMMPLNYLKYSAALTIQLLCLKTRRFTVLAIMRN